MKTLWRDSMLVITLFLNVPDIETKDTDLETWQGNSFQFCTSQKDFITFLQKNVFQYWRVWGLLSRKDKNILFTVTLVEVFVTRSVQFCQFYICQFCQPSPTPFAASLNPSYFFFQDTLDPNYSYLTFPDLQRATKTQNQNTCAEWSGDDIQNDCHILFDWSVIILTHQVGTDQWTDRRFRNNGEKCYLKTSAIVFLIIILL